MAGLDVTDAAFQSDGSLSCETVSGIVMNLLSRASAIRVEVVPRKNANLMYRVSIPNVFFRPGAAGSTAKLFVKYFKTPEENEARNLEVVCTSGLARLPFGNKSFPVITLAERHFSYMFQGSLRCLSVLHAAKGKSVHEHLLDFLVCGSDGKKKELVQRAFLQTGTAMAMIHHRFAVNPTAEIRSIRTYVHGDLHSENVFYDPAQDRIYFIDNEFFAESIRTPTHFAPDILSFVGWVSSLERPGNQELFAAFYREFVQGYAFVGFKEVQDYVSELVCDARKNNPYARFLPPNESVKSSK